MRLLVLALVLCSSLFAVSDDEVCRGCGRKKGDSYSRVYDPDHVRLVSGTILEVGKIQGGTGSTYGVHLMMRSKAGEVVDVHLGPSWYITRKGLSFQPGDTIGVTGSEVMMDGRQVMIAQRISTPKASARLRDEDGKPAWAASRSWSD